MIAGDVPSPGATPGAAWLNFTGICPPSANPATVSVMGGPAGPGMPAAPLDHQENYLRAVFTFFGITDLTFVRAEGVALGAEARNKALETARGEVTRLAA